MALPEPSSRFQTAGCSSILKKGIVGSRKSCPATLSLHRTVQRIDKTMKMKTTAVKIISRVQDPLRPNKRRVTLEYFDQKSSKPKKLVLIFRNHQDTNQQQRSRINKEKEIIREDPMKRVRERRALEIQQRLEKERLEKLRREEQERLAKERLQEERKAARRALEKMEREANVDDYYHTMTEFAMFAVYDRNCPVPGMEERLAKERLQKEREALRMALEKMERDAYFEDQLQTMKEFESLGVSVDKRKDILGLVLKQDDEDEEMEG